VSLGCPKALVDSERIITRLRAEGYELSRQHQGSDLVIVNTCGFLDSAKAESLGAIGAALKENGKVIVTGCMGAEPENISAAYPDVLAITGPQQYESVLDAVHKALPPQHDPFLDLVPPEGIKLTPRHYAYLKISEGCNNRCSFCIIPFVRGRSRSAPVEQVVEQVRGLSARYREIVLSGINLGRWGREPGSRMRLADLVRLLLAETDVARLRLSSVEPMDFSDDLLHLMAESGRVARHVHAPLQSGSDRVLRRMHRKYRPRHYADRVLKARTLMPEAAIGADVMVGFPGETEAEFEESRRFIDEMPFTYLHVFTYSERPGTPAAESAEQVPMKVRKERNRILRELAAAKNRAFREAMVGRTLSGVTLDEGGIALTDNYLKVEMSAPRPANRIVDLHIGQVTDAGLSEASRLPLLK
jgi:MiaB/RimO family radical SAM methylthiotransferase